MKRKFVNFNNINFSFMVEVSYLCLKFLFQFVTIKNLKESNFFRIIY